MRTKRSRFALLGVLVLALCVSLGAVGAAEAKKGDGGSGKKTLNFKAGVVPDAVDFSGAPPGSNGAQQLGIFSSCKKVGSKASAKIKSTEFELSFTSADISEIQVLLTGPRGLIDVTRFNDNQVPPGSGAPSTGFGPATFKDDAALDIDDTHSTADGPGFETAGLEAYAPYAGEFRPEGGLLSSLGSRTGGTWCVVAFDAAGPASAGPGDPDGIASITSAKLKFKTKG